jgi:hypothetical protein
MYKIMQNNTVIDVVQNPRFVRFLASGHIALTDKASAQGIVGSDETTLYSFENRPGYSKVLIKKIMFEEFSRLQSLLNSKQEVSTDESALALAKSETVKHLSNICNAKIIDGFSIKLADGNAYNFKLTTEDQLNLMHIENQFNAGEKLFIYHATDLPCRAFVREDMGKVLKAFRKHILYHTTYFNVVKQYINAQTSIDRVMAFTYGTDISDTVTDPTIRQILKKGGAFR